MTPVGAEGLDWLNNYSRLKDSKNVLADSVQAAINTYRENKTLGRGNISSMLQAATSAIGEATGFGADRIRGLDVTKPIDQHRAEGKGSWANWFYLPLVGIKDQTVAQWRDKQAGLQGQVYTPEPSPATPEYAEALEDTGGKIQTDTPVYNPDTEAPQVNQTTSPVIAPKVTPSQGPADNPVRKPTPKPVTSPDEAI